MTAAYVRVIDLHHQHEPATNFKSSEKFGQFEFLDKSGVAPAAADAVYPDRRRLAPACGAYGRSTSILIMSA